MQAFLDRIMPAVRGRAHGPEDVPRARGRLHELRTAQRELELAAGRNRRWWLLRIREEQTLMLLQDYASALSLAAEILGAGDIIDPRTRMSVEIDVLRVCLDVQPFAQIRDGMDLVFARECYGVHGTAHHLACLIRAQLARRRGDLRLAEECYHEAWKAFVSGWLEPVGFMEILIGCVEHAYLRGAGEELAKWLTELERLNRGFPCDEFRVRFARILAMRPSQFYSGAVDKFVRECGHSLAMLDTMAERAQYWECARWLVYLLAGAGAADRAAAWQHLIPVRRQFEHQLWRVDCEWFMRFQELGLPPPELRPHPGSIAASHCTGNVDTPLRARLTSGYRTAASAASAEDARLECRWRSELISSRLAHLGRHS